MFTKDRRWAVGGVFHFQYIPRQYVQIPCRWLIITAKEEEQASHMVGKKKRRRHTSHKLKKKKINTN